MIDESQIEYLLNGERAEADVLNRPLKQLVSATNASLSEVNGVITEILDSSLDSALEDFREEIGNVADGASQLIEERYDEIFEVTRDGNGFTREKDAQLIFDAGKATVSIAPGLGKSTWVYYHKGRKIESSATLTYTLSEADKTDGGFYLSFDKDGNFVNTGPYPDFYKTTLCFYVHYSNGEFIIEGDERHAADRDTAWHHSHHREDGMVIYTLGNIDWTPDDANKVGIQITSTLVADEDLQHLIKHSPTGVEPFCQILEGSQDTVRIPTLYYDGNIRYLANKKLPWVASALKYNDGTTLKDVPNGKFVNYFLAATHCQKYPIKLIMGRKIFDSEDETVDETLESLGLNFPEMALLYRISLERDNSLSTVGKCKLKSVQQAASKITFESAAGSTGSGLSNHAQLLGRTGDNAHPVSAITGLQEDLDSKVNKVIGKQLSTNDLTNALKNKLDNLPNVVGGAIPISGGGTGATTAAAARTALGLGATATRWPTFDEVTAKPDAYEPVAHTHPWTQVTGKPTQATRWPTFAEVTDKPETATRWPTWSEVTGVPGSIDPSAHTHPVSQVTGLDAILTGKADKTTQVIAGTGLTGGGDLSANRTISVNYGTDSGTAAQGNDSRITGALQKSQVVQTTGTSTTNVMSQKATTDALNTKAPSSHTHPWTEVTGQPATATRWPTFDEVADKPETATRWPTWSEVMGVPGSIDPSAHTHPWDQVTGQPATATRWPTFDEVADKPTTFDPSAHTHPWDQVTGQPATATRWPTFDEVADKPTTFDPSAHTHSVSEITGLGTAATADLTTSTTDGTVGRVLKVGDGGWMGHGEKRVTPYGYPTSSNDVTNQTKVIRSSVVDNGVSAQSAGIHFASPDTWGRLRVAHATQNAWLQAGSAISGIGWTSQVVLSDNLLQTTGNSTTFPMSQKATTDALNTKAPSSHTHPWTEVTGKPTTFTPSAHTHPWDQVTGLQEALGDINKATTDAIANIPSVPKSTPYTVVAGDKGKSIDTSANVTIPPNVFAVGDTLVVTSTTAGEVRVIPGAGVTIRHAGTEDIGTAVLLSYGVITLRMVTNNNWRAIGMGMSI